MNVTPKLPTDRGAEVEIGNLLMSTGSLDKDTFIQEYAGHQNPQEIRQKVLRDKIMESPEFVRVAVLATAMQTGIIDYVLDTAQKTGADPTAFLQAVGFGTPAPQQPAGPNAPINPLAAAAQHTPSTAPDATQHAQPSGGFNITPSPQQQVRNQAAPGVPIR